MVHFTYFCITQRVTYRSCFDVYSALSNKSNEMK
jgi:hypothetical protein